MRISSNSPWEEIVGYSRAVRIGAHVAVSGTTAATSDGGATAPDAYGQTVEILRRIADTLEQAGGSMVHVVRTRIYVTNIEDWREVARAHAEVFGAIRPSATMVEVSRLIAPEFLVEIEADAIVHDADREGEEADR